MKERESQCGRQRNLLLLDKREQSNTGNPYISRGASHRECKSVRKGQRGPGAYLGSRNMIRWCLHKYPGVHATPFLDVRGTWTKNLGKEGEIGWAKSDGGGSSPSKMETEREGGTKQGDEFPVTGGSKTLEG